MSQNERFSLGGYWLDREPKSPNWQRCWYDRGTRKVRRRSLATPDLEEAKARLVAFVLEDPARPAGDPQEVLLLVCLKHYWESYSDLRPRPENARRPGELLLDFLGNDAVVGALTKSRQEAFMRWLAEEHNHSVATISRHLSIISAALKRAMEPHEVLADDGCRATRRLLIDCPKIYYQTGHPRLANGAMIGTSPLLWLADDRSAARTVSRFYRLGIPLAEAMPQQS